MSDENLILQRDAMRRDRIKIDTLQIQMDFNQILIWAESAGLQLMQPTKMKKFPIFLVIILIAKVAHFIRNSQVIICFYFSLIFTFIFLPSRLWLVKVSVRLYFLCIILFHHIIYISLNLYWTSDTLDYRHNNNNNNNNVSLSLSPPLPFLHTQMHTNSERNGFQHLFQISSCKINI